jgi:hypothetical protein
MKRLRRVTRLGNNGGVLVYDYLSSLKAAYR